MACKHCDMSELFVGQRVILRGGALKGKIIEIRNENYITVEYGHTWGNPICELSYRIHSFHSFGTPDSDAELWILAEPQNPLEVL